MDQQIETASTPAAKTNQYSKTYSLRGTLTKLDFRVTKNGEPYFYAKVTNETTGLNNPLTVMGFARALDKLTDTGQQMGVRDQLVEGGTVAFRGQYQRGDTGGQIFVVNERCLTETEWNERKAFQPMAA